MFSNKGDPLPNCTQEESEFLVKNFRGRFFSIFPSKSDPAVWAEIIRIKNKTRNLLP